ncbi:MAG: fluoride efflux transporter CrcB [Bacteroidota bacterium]
MMEWLAVFMGGGLGSMLRFGLSKWIGTAESGFPIATLAANILSCVVLGFAWIYFAKNTNFPAAYKSLILVGFCGGFSTFSTFSFETLKLIQAGEWLLAAIYVLLSISSCLLILWLITKS